MSTLRPHVDRAVGAELAVPSRTSFAPWWAVLGAGAVVGVGLFALLARPARAAGAITGGAGRRMTDFDVATSGLHFPNGFPDSTYAGIKFPGLCGGMSWTVLDYLNAGRSAPATTEVPHMDSPLGAYIHQRQFDSLFGPDPLSSGTQNLARFAKMLLNPSDEFVASQTDDEFAVLRTYIDRGRVTPIGLIPAKTFDVTEAHQVLATGYEQAPDGAKTVYLWDSNVPQKTGVAMVRLPGSTVWVEKATGDRWRGFFVESGYEPKTPPNV